MLQNNFLKNNVIFAKVMGTELQGFLVSHQQGLHFFSIKVQGHFMTE